MREFEIEEEVEFCAEEKEDYEVVVQERKVKPRARRSDALDPDLVGRARALYIANNMTLTQISKVLGINEHTLTDYSKKERWSLFKAKPEMEVWTEDMFGEIYDNLGFYNLAKNVCKDMLEQDVFQTPRDVKAIVETFRMADERSSSLYLIRENAVQFYNGEEDES